MDHGIAAVGHGPLAVATARDECVAQRAWRPGMNARESAAQKGHVKFDSRESTHLSLGHSFQQIILTSAEAPAQNI